MSKLSKMGEWLALSETATILSGILGDEVTEARVLRLALDGRLALSIHWFRPVVARVIYLEDISRESGDWSGKHCSNSNFEKIKNLTSASISGVFDIHFVGFERKILEREWRALLKGESMLDRPLTDYSNDEVCVKHGDSFFAIQEIDRQRVEASPEKENTSLPNAFGANSDQSGLTRTNKFPQDSILVIRTDALQEFVDSVNRNEKLGVETPQQRLGRFNEYVGKAKASGKSKTSAFKELAAIEGCSVENIRRIYYRKGEIG